MIRQYYPQRFRRETLGGRERHVGTVPVGTVPVGTVRRVAVGGRLRTLIVVAWLPREIGAGRLERGRWVSAWVANAGHLAVVRFLDDGRTATVSDWLLLERD